MSPPTRRATLTRTTISRVIATGSRAASLAAVLLVWPSLAGPGDVLTAGAVAQPARQAGGIRGRVDLRRVARPVERRPEVAEPGAGGPREVADRRQAVVYLETVPGAAFGDAEPARAVMDQRNERFVPHLLAVMVGTVVDFPNSDRTYHNVFSLSRAKRFDLGRYAAGHSKSVRMDRPGVVRVFCDIHPHMSARVLVFAHRFFGVTGADGRFTIPNVPAGTYTVVGWHEGEARASRAVTVTPGAWADLELLIP